MQPLRGSQCSPFLWGDYRRLAFRRRGRLRYLRSKAPSAVAGLALRSPFLRGDYRRRAFRRRGRLLSWLAQRSPFLCGRRRGRLLSRLRSALPSSVVAGETPALQAAQCSPFLWGKLPTPSVSQARRLLSRLRSVRPSFGESYRRRAFRRRGRLLSRLRSALPSSVVAGETPALQASAALFLPLRKLPTPGVPQARRGCVEPEALFVDSPGF